MDITQRLEKVRQLVEAIDACEGQDAEMVIAAILEERRAGMPGAPLDTIEEEAETWAALASLDEARAWFLACGRRLTDFPLGPKGRTRMAIRMLEGLPPEDRAEALQAVAAAVSPAMRSAA